MAMTREERNEKGPGISSLSRTGNSMGYVKRNGEYMAMTHKTGNAAGGQQTMAAGSKINSTYKDSFVDPTKTKEKLTPYHWNAPRSRLDYVKVDVKPYARFCKPRNEMSYDPKMPQQPGFNQFLTTNQIYQQYPEVMDWHQGIVSAASKQQHKNQQTR